MAANRTGGVRVPRAARWLCLLVFGALWWWAAIRMARPGPAGPVEGVIVVGGWGLSLLPVHVVPRGEADRVRIRRARRRMTSDDGAADDLS